MTKTTEYQFAGHVASAPVSSLDSHWYPVWLQCGHCSLRYDLVLRSWSRY